MLVEKEKIHKAKEKLGEKNAFEIAHILGVENFDESRLRACCPFHEEDTPSWIYNPKTYNFHCFGCGISTDIIDAYMIKGHTYLEAVQYLFEKAGIKYAFGEMGVKTKTQYRYPKPVECHSKDKIKEYLGLRKISPSTIDYCDIRQDSHGNIVFNYYDTNDVLTLVKYRPSHKIDKSKGEVKTWCQKDADTSPILFNMNRVNIDSPLLICEGEIDCASAIEAGFTNAVSVPLGAGNFHWIEHNWEWLEQFSDIIVCADNDEAGQKMIKEVSSRLGNWRTKIVQLPTTVTKSDGSQAFISDLNETLYWFGKEYVLKLILDAKDSPVDSVIDFSDIEDVDLSQIDGIYTGITELDNKLMKMFYGTVTILTGTNGSGKSSLLSQFICQSLDQQKSVWLYSKELPNSMMKNWIDFIFAGRHNIDQFHDSKGATYYKVSKSARTQIDGYYKNRLYIYKDDYDNSVDSIKKSMEDCVRKYGCKMLILDNLTVINLGATDNNKNETQNAFMSWLTKFAATFQVVIVLVIHPRKGQQVTRLCKYDIGGSGGMLDLAHRSFSLYRVKPNEKQTGDESIKNYDVILDVLKDRMRGQENLSIPMWYDPPSRRFYTNEMEFGKQYAWDKNKYTESIPFPHPDETSEVFGKED